VVVRSSVGGPEISVENTAVILVDKDGVAQTLSGGGGGGSVTVSGIKATAASFDAIATSATGATFVSLTAGTCTEVAILNVATTAVDLEVRRGGAGQTVTLPFGSSQLFEAITNSSDIQIRRLDQSNTSVTVKFERRTR
jgi:hypothetical protein